MSVKFCASAVCAVMFAAVCSAAPVVKSNDKIAFLGDSITQYGNNYKGGYVNLVIAGLKANGINAVKIPAGISGNRSTHMLARVEKDVISRKPQIMTLSCGVNDVWHGKRGVPLPEYKKNISALVDKVQAAGIKVCILTATMIAENPKNAHNVKLKEYNDFLRQLAKEKNCLLADVSADMHKGIADMKKKYPAFKGNLYTNDGVHMNPYGDAMMAERVLRTFGLNDAQIAKAKAAWKNLHSSIGRVLLSSEDVAKLAPLAAAEKLTIQDYIARMIRELPDKK